MGTSLEFIFDKTKSVEIHMIGWHWGQVIAFQR